MQRAQINPMPEYFDRYILQADDADLSEALQASLRELDALPLDKWRALGDRTYEPGKWTVKDTLQHLIDTERIFSYRAMCFARGETTRLPSYDEAEYAAAAQPIASRRQLDDLIEELKAVRRSSMAFFNSLDDEHLQKTGLSFKGVYQVLAIGFILPGHQRHHLRILRERYESMLI